MIEELTEIEHRLADETPAGRRVAVMQLAELAHEPGAERLLVRALGDSDASVRAEAAGILDEFPPERITEALIGALTAADAIVRDGAARSLADLKDPAAGPALLAALVRSEAPFVTASVLRALRNLRYVPALRAAIELTGHADASVRREAVGLLGYLPDGGSLKLIGEKAASDPEPEVRRQAVAALVGGAAEVVAPFLVRALEDDSWQVRAESAKVLGRIQVFQAVPALVQAAADDVWQVREKAAEALGSMRERAREGLPALGRCAAEPISNLRKAAIAALGEIGDPAARRYLEPALEDADPDVRKLARWALGRLESAA